MDLGDMLCALLELEELLEGYKGLEVSDVREHEGDHQGDRVAMARAVRAALRRLVG